MCRSDVSSRDVTMHRDATEGEERGGVSVSVPVQGEFRVGSQGDVKALVPERAPNTTGRRSDRWGRVGVTDVV